jgi:hypothetical protein
MRVALIVKTGCAGTARKVQARDFASSGRFEPLGRGCGLPGVLRRECRSSAWPAGRPWPLI